MFDERKWIKYRIAPLIRVFGNWSRIPTRFTKLVRCYSLSLIRINPFKGAPSREKTSYIEIQLGTQFKRQFHHKK